MSGAEIERNDYEPIGLGKGVGLAFIPIRWSLWMIVIPYSVDDGDFIFWVVSIAVNGRICSLSGKKCQR